MSPESLFLELFHYPKKTPHPLSSCYHLPLPHPRQQLTCHLSPLLCLLQIFSINGIILPVAFCVWFLSNNNLLLSRVLIPTVACIVLSLFFFLATSHSTVWIFCLSIHLLMDLWVICTFWLFWIELLWTFVYKILSEHLLWLSSSGFILRSGIAGFYGNSTFNLLRNCQTIFRSNCTILNSYQQCISVPISPYPHWQSLISTFGYIYFGVWEVISHCGFNLHFPDG